MKSTAISIGAVLAAGMGFAAKDEVSSLPEAVLLNSNAVDSAKIAACGWTFSSDVPTSGTVRVFCLQGAEKVSAPQLTGEWEVSEDSVVSASVEGVSASASVGDVVFRMEFSGGGDTNSTERSMTVAKTGNVRLPDAPDDGLVVLTNTAVAFLLDCEPDGAGALLDTAWHVRRLKSDGSFEEWRLAGCAQRGVSLAYTPELGGIYQIKALASAPAGGADERFYVWEQDEDEITGIKRKGDLKAFGVCDEQWQIDLRDCAKAYLGSTEYALQTELGGRHGFAAVEDGSWKCNYFVAYRIREAGLQLAPNRHSLWRNYPPMANDWSNGAQISGWLYLGTNLYAQPGYVIGHPSVNSSGHCGIVDFDGEAIAAGAENVNRRFPSWNDGTAGFNKYNFNVNGGGQ